MLWVDISRYPFRRSKTAAGQYMTDPHRPHVLGARLYLLTGGSASLPGVDVCLQRVVHRPEMYILATKHNLVEVCFG